MKKLYIKDKYRLELYWSDVNYFDDTTAILKQAYFYGPGLKNADKIGAPDYIDLDFTLQYGILLDAYFIARLKWSLVEYQNDGRVKLGDVVLLNDKIKHICNIQKNDFIVIDTSKHETELHPYNLVYASQIRRKDGSLYEYGKI